MSFRCEFCLTVAPNGSKLRMIPTEERVKHYENGTVGREIVKEQRCCEKCWNSGTLFTVTTHSGTVALMFGESKVQPNIPYENFRLTFG